MADIGHVTHLAASRAQLPVSAYFDEALFQREQETIFAHAPLYVGHEKMLADVGDYRTLAQENEGRVLIKSAQGIELLSNVCRHRQALMLGGQAYAHDKTAPNVQSRGSLGPNGHIVCPLHRWTYHLSGKLIGAPLFEHTPDLNLSSFPLQTWNGSLFEAPLHGQRQVSQELAALNHLPEFDFSDYVLDHVEVHHCPYNWKTFIEVYLEDYHVGPFHPGLGQFVTCDDLEWKFGEHFSLQRVGIHAALAQPGSATYQRWHEALLAYREGRTPDLGAIWVVHYPTHMIELYPHTLVLSTLYPKSPQETVNIVEFYYPEEIVHFERAFIEAQRAAYLETALEDDEIAERMDAGRRALMLRNTSEIGPYQSPMEDGMQHFHEWYGNTMANSATN